MPFGDDLNGAVDYFDGRLIVYCVRGHRQPTGPFFCVRHVIVIAHYKCPRTVNIVDALPRNPVGKILKRTLRAPYWQGRDRQI